MNGFSGPKRFRDFRETGPWFQSMLDVLTLIASVRYVFGTTYVPIHQVPTLIFQDSADISMAHQVYVDLLTHARILEFSATKSSGTLSTSMAALGLVIACVDSHFLTERLTLRWLPMVF